MAEIIINGSFEGYLWKSDMKEPEVFSGDNLQKDLILNDEENPFYIEGQLYDLSTKLSVSIKYVDGEYKVNKYLVKQLDENRYCFYEKKKVGDREELVPIQGEVVMKSFKGNHLKGHNLLFAELWQEKEDQRCHNMMVLMPTKVAFVGFE